MKKFLLGLFAFLIGCTAFAADVKGEAGNLKGVLEMWLHLDVPLLQQESLQVR